MNKWEAIAIMVTMIVVFSMLSITEYSREKTEQYKIQYNCNE